MKDFNVFDLRFGFSTSKSGLGQLRARGKLKKRVFFCWLFFLFVFPPFFFGSLLAFLCFLLVSWPALGCGRGSRCTTTPLDALGLYNFKRTQYAHIEVLVTFLLVNFIGFLVIARNPPERF